MKGEPKNLEWHLRVNIAVGIARGLARLHNHNTLQLAHLNLSSSCILLDKHFEPRISNFGRAMHIMTSNARIFMANIEMGEWDLTKRDVHQLGVLLLELITGEDPLNNSGFYHSLEGKLVQNNCLYIDCLGCTVLRGWQISARSRIRSWSPWFPEGCL